MIIISGNENIVDFIIEFQVEYMTDEDINDIKKFILKYNPDISDKDIEVICEEYWDLIGYYKISERNTWVGIKRDASRFFKYYLYFSFRLFYFIIESI